MPVSSNSCGSASCLPTTQTSKPRSRSSTRRSSQTPRAGPAGTATTATATATGKPTVIRGRLRTRARAISGRCCRPSVASIGFRNGGPAGSAAPLTWSAASFVRLAGDLDEGRNVVLPKATYQRYVKHTQGATTLAVTSPADNSSVSGPPVTVTGTTAPGNTVYVAATNTDANSATTPATTTAPARTSTRRPTTSTRARSTSSGSRPTTPARTSSSA